MGYTTDFDGEVKTDRPVDDKTYELINGLNRTRRMKRKIEGYGVEGEFYFNPDSNSCGQDWDDPTIVDSNNPPRTQPGLWMQWKMNSDKQTIEWDGGEKFYDYIEWMVYLIDKILAPKGYKVN